MSQQTVAPHAFRAIVMKELRANIRWALLGAIVTSVCLLLPVAFASRDPGPNLVMILSLLTGCAPLVGLMLGVAAVLSENRGDQLGFLLHRPMPRSSIFLAKTAAGLLMYLAAVGMPLALLTAWAAAPGNVAVPFSLLLLRPAVVDLATGVVAFFIAFMCTMRDARWFGTRWVALAAPYPVLFTVYSVSEFWLALLVSGAAALVFGLAAWGTFVAAGGYEGQPIAGRIATGLSIGSGLAIAGVLVLAFAVAMVYDLFPTESYGGGGERPGALEVTRDGPVRVTRLGGNIATIEDLSGNTIDREQMARMVNPVREYSLEVSPPSRSAATYREEEDVYAKLMFPRPSEPNIHWYYLHPQQLLAAYDRNTRRRIGWVGPGGFAAAGARTPEGFSDHFLHDGAMTLIADSTRQPVRLLVFRSAVYAFEPATQSLSLLFRAPPGDTIRSATPADAGRLLVATTNALYLRSPDGAQSELKHVGEFLRHVTLYRILSDVPTEMYVRYHGRDTSGAYTEQLVRFSPSGDETERYPMSVTPPPGYVVVGTTQDILEAARPPALQLVHPRPVLREDWDGSAVHHRGWFTSLLLFIAALSISATLVLSRRHAFSSSRTTVWALLGLALGPLGVLLMLSLVEWPQRERCPACGKQRVVIRDRCEHCTRGFTPPEKDGTEILELAAQD